MSPEAQHIALMESLGWRKESGFMEYDGAFLPWTVWVRNGEKVGNDKAPNFLNDLNAMHEAEKTLIDWVEYRINLSHVVGIGYAPDLDICDDIKSFLSATAAQRAEAFMRTKGLWKEKKE